MKKNIKDLFPATITIEKLSKRVFHTRFCNGAMTVSKITRIPIGYGKYPFISWGVNSGLITFSNKDFINLCSNVNMMDVKIGDEVTISVKK